MSPSSPRVHDLLERLDARGGTRAGGRPSARVRRRAAAATTCSASATDWASGFSTKQCLPASQHPLARAPRGVGTGVASDDRVELVVGQQLVERRRWRARSRERPRPSARRASSDSSQSQAQLGVRQPVEVAREVRAPVAEADDARPGRGSSAHRRTRCVGGSMPRVTPRKSTTERRPGDEPLARRAPGARSRSPTQSAPVERARERRGPRSASSGTKSSW